MAKDVGEAEKIASEIGYPVVVKADAESIVHKSDMGGSEPSTPRRKFVTPFFGLFIIFCKASMFI